MYQAKIYCDAYEDNYNEGQDINSTNSWDITLTSESIEDLTRQIEYHTYSTVKQLDDEQMNDYDNCTEYSWTYLANADNEGEATQAEIDQWKEGKLRLWAIHCHILVSELTQSKAKLF